MSDTNTTNQQELGAFDTPTTQSDTDPSQETPTGPSPETTTEEYKTPLDELYEQVDEIAPNFVPPEASTLATAKPLSPTTKRHTTKDLPEPIPALPSKIGQWELATASPEQIIYVTSGDAYDHRWGDGGSLYGVEVYLNNRGYNKDGNYHRRSHTLVGFENGDQIRRKDVESRSDLISVRGFNPGKNDGDYGIGSGTETQAETAKEAVLELIVYLHHNPGPLGRFIDRDPQHGWSLQKLSPRTGRWTAEAPPEVDAEQVSLSIANTTVRIKAINEEEATTKSTYYDIPELDMVSASLIAEQGKSHTLETPAAAVTAVNEILSQPPVDALTAGKMP